ncbi:hypothetical protein TNCV_3488511 [Trichonephila clavipes]|nr:hypothetical protein TNCV_3488511 [Trichonephila clavipes]
MREGSLVYVTDPQDRRTRFPNRRQQLHVISGDLGSHLASSSKANHKFVPTKSLICRTRRRGQPPTRWLDDVEKDLKWESNDGSSMRLMGSTGRGSWSQLWLAKGC